MQKRLILPFLLIIIIIALSCTKKVVEVRYAPVLYDLVAPDSIQRGSTDIYYIFVTVYDPDGLSNVDSVYFIATRPDSTSNGLHLGLRDDAQFGDSVANDGRFTLGIRAGDSNSQLGNYKFTFYARDKQGDISNTPQAIVTEY